MQRIRLRKRQTTFLIGVVCLSVGIGAALASRFLTSFSDSQFKRVAHEFHFKGIPFTGIAYERHPNGKLGRLALLWKGRKVLKEYQWHSNGKKLAESTYDLEGRRQGDWMMWHPDGQPKSLTHYVQNQKQGEQWAWHPNGTLVEYNVHEADRTVTHKSWIFDGTPYYNYVYQDGDSVGVKGGDFCRPQGLVSLNKAFKK